MAHVIVKSLALNHPHEKHQRKFWLTKDRMEQHRISQQFTPIRGGILNRTKQLSFEAGWIGQWKKMARK